MDKLLLFAGMLASSVALCGGTMPAGGLEWELSGNARLANDLVVVDSPDRTGGAASAKLDLSAYADEAVMISVRGQAKDVAVPPNHWNGIKVMVSYRDAERAYYPEAYNAKVGTFGPTVFRLMIDQRGRKLRDFAMTLGLENTSGRIEFDLRTFKIEKMGPCAYTERVTKMPRLKGFMLQHYTAQKEEDFQTLASWGAHLARFQMVRSVPAAERGNRLLFERWLDERLDWFDKALELGRKYRILLVLDMHSTPGGDSGAQGNYGIFGPGPERELFLRAWEKIAARYRGRKGIYAYDLVNEPHNNRERKTGDCWELQYEAISRIRAIDPEMPITYETDWGDLPQPYAWLAPLPFKNIIYQVHVYDPFPFTHQNVGAGNMHAPIAYPGTSLDGKEKYDRERMLQTLKPVRDFQRRWGARVFVGEFSAAVWAPGADRYLADAISFFDEYGWDWTYHAFREAGCWSLELEGTHEKVVPSADNPRKRVVMEGLQRQ